MRAAAWSGVVWIALVLGCGEDPPKDSASLDQSCAPYPIPDDAPTEDVIVSAGSGYICYRPSPDGTCISVAGGDAAFTAYEGGKASVGCEEGVLVINGSCPQDLVLGQCRFEALGEDWSVYPCNRWDDLVGSEAAGCEGQGGRWVPTAE